jgi:hypothetical protein
MLADIEEISKMGGYGPPAAVKDGYWAFWLLWVDGPFQIRPYDRGSYAHPLNGCEVSGSIGPSKSYLIPVDIGDAPRNSQSRSDPVGFLL